MTLVMVKYRYQILNAPGSLTLPSMSIQIIMKHLKSTTPEQGNSQNWFSLFNVTTFLECKKTQQKTPPHTHLKLKISHVHWEKKSPNMINICNKSTTRT